MSSFVALSFRVLGFGDSGILVFGFGVLGFGSDGWSVSFGFN